MRPKNRETATRNSVTSPEGWSPAPLRRLRRRVRLVAGYPHVVTLLILFGPLLLLILVGKLARIQSQYFAPLELADFLRSEIFFVTAIVLAFAGAVLIARSARLRWAFTLTAGLSWLIICLTEVFGTSYQLTTGDDGFTYPLLVYGVKKLPDIMPMFSAEISKSVVPLLALSLLIALFVVAYGYLIRQTRVRRHRRNRRLGWGLLLASPVALAIASLPGYYSNDLLASRDLTVNAGLDALDLLLDREPRIAPIRDSFPTDARVVADPVAGSPATAPNLVIIILESTRASAVTIYNPALDTTPYLNKLAATSIVARRAYALVPQTSKSLVSILCGLESYLRRGVHEARPDLGVPGKCLARLLREHGYRTAFFQSATKTFEHRAGLVANFGFETFTAGDDMDASGFEAANYFGVEDRIMLAPSRAWLEAGDGRPLFVTYLTNTPHHPYLAPRRYGRRDFSPRKTFNRYLNSVNYLDHFVADLIRQYKDLGLYENTVFIIFGDHGEGFREHRRKQHIATIYDEGLHVPLLIHDGRAPRAGIIPGPVSLLDVMPSALALLGLRVENGDYAGWPMWARPPDAPVFSHCWRERQCMAEVRGDYKLIHHFDNSPDQLFDLAADPGERHDLAARFPRRAADMRAELKTWRAGVNAYYRAYRQLVKSRAP